MTRRIWTKPQFKSILSGNIDKSRSLERKARANVGYLFEQLKPNQKFLSQNWTLGDGSTMSCYVWNDALGKRALVKIFTTSGEVKWIQFIMNHGFYQKELLYLPDSLENLSDGLFTPFEVEINSKKYRFAGNATGEILEPSTGVNWFERTFGPHRYSGLTRLFIQSIYSRGITLEQFFENIRYSLPIPIQEDLYFPLTMHYSYHNHIIPWKVGCIRSPDNQYWLIIWGKFGIYGALLKPDPLFSGYENILKNISINTNKSQVVREMADAWRLGYRSPFTNASEFIELVSSSDSTFVELDGPGTNWKDIQQRDIGCRFQHRGAVDENISNILISFRTTNDGSTNKTIRLNFNFPDPSFGDTTPTPVVTFTTEAATIYGDTSFEWASGYKHDGSRWIFTSTVNPGGDRQYAVDLVQSYMDALIFAVDSAQITFYSGTPESRSIVYSFNGLSVPASPGPFDYVDWGFVVGSASTCEDYKHQVVSRGYGGTAIHWLESANAWAVFELEGQILYQQNSYSTQYPHDPLVPECVEGGSEISGLVYYYKNGAAYLITDGEYQTMNTAQIAFFRGIEYLYLYDGAIAYTGQNSYGGTNITVLDNVPNGIPIDNEEGIWVGGV